MGDLASGSVEVPSYVSGPMKALWSGGRFLSAKGLLNKPFSSYEIPSDMDMEQDVMINGLPRDHRELAKNPSLAAQMIVGQLADILPPAAQFQIAQNVVTSLTTGSEGQKEAFVSQLQQQFPSAFQAAPDGYETYQAGKIYGQDRDEHLKRVLNELSDGELADAIGGLLENGVYTALPSSPSLVDPAKNPEAVQGLPSMVPPVELPAVGQAFDMSRDSSGSYSLGALPSGSQTANKMNEILNRRSQQINVAKSGL